MYTVLLDEPLTTSPQQWLKQSSSIFVED